jgi:thymidine phosphorylase
MTDFEIREAIATLPGHVGYQALLEVINGLVQDAVVLVVNAESEEKTLKAARNLQALFKYFNVLSTVPQNIQAEFAEEKLREFESGQDPSFPPQRRQLLEQIEKTHDPNMGQIKKRK